MVSRFKNAKKLLSLTLVLMLAFTMMIPATHALAESSFNTYSVTLNPNGGYWLNSENEQLVCGEGATITLPTATPTRDGFKFLGWASTATSTFTQFSAGGDFKDTAHANAILYAVWQVSAAQTLTLGASEWYPPQTQASISVQVSSNVPWTAVSSDASWLTVAPDSGTGNGVLTLSATANTSASDRTGIVMVTGNGIIRMIFVEQAVTTAATLTLDSSEWDPTQVASITTIQVQSNSSWTAASSDTSWLTVAPDSGQGNGGLTLKTTENTGAVDRTGTITVACSGITKTLTVKQAAAAQTGLILGSTTWNPAHVGSSASILLLSNSSWTATSSDTSWLLVSPTSASGSGALTLNAKTNTGTWREGTITVTGNGITRTIQVAQQGQIATILDFSSTTWDSIAAPSIATVSVYSNVDWKATSSDASWLTVTPDSATDNGTLTLESKPNTGTNSRTAIITVVGGGLTKTITVTQEAPYLELDTTDWNLGPVGSTMKVDLTSNVAWTATSSDASWLTVSPDTGVGNGTLTLEAKANAGSSSRSGTITVTGNGLTRTVNVKQDGPSLELDASSWNPGPDKSTDKVGITSNFTWTVSKSPASASWLTYSPSSGSDSGVLTLNVEENTSTSSRSASITVTCGGITKEITVKQDGIPSLYLDLDTTSFSAPIAGLSKTVAVTSNVTWAVDAPDWISVKSGSGTNNGTFTLVVDPNDVNAPPRAGTVNVSGGGITKKIDVSQSGVPSGTTYTITYDLQGGAWYESSDVVESQTCTAGDTITIQLNKPEKFGFSFSGWSANKNATTADFGFAPGMKYVPVASITLYAVWKAEGGVWSSIGDVPGTFVSWSFADIYMSKEAAEEYYQILLKDPTNDALNTASILTGWASTALALIGLGVVSGVLAILSAALAVASGGIALVDTFSSISINQLGNALYQCPDNGFVVITYRYQDSDAGGSPLIFINTSTDVEESPGSDWTWASAE